MDDADPRLEGCADTLYDQLRGQAATAVIPNPVTQSSAHPQLIGDLAGAYSRRINIQHRLVYQVLQDEQVVKVLRLWSHYD